MSQRRRGRFLRYLAVRMPRPSCVMMPAPIRYCCCCCWCAGAEHGEGVTDPETVFNGAARGDVNYVHYCLEANGSIIKSSHGAEGSSLLHVACNTGNIDLTQVNV